MQKILLALITISILISCSKTTEGEIDNSSTDDGFLIIGLTYGECGGDCSHFYKLEMGEVFADTEEAWWNQTNDPTFNNESLDDASVLSNMEQLNSEFPDYLIQTEEVSFGCPDCGDWGALHVFKNVDGEQQYWTLDNQIESNPEEIQAWAMSMQTLIYELMN